ncbi:uncharacterized protein PG986_012655 [Apiospora aurea]|uniref:Enoyl reductase (ER) domain-containing protein n=1 Tax=Apiospora aurea TaxID=335848 RepID=A0ABR1Q0M6_9PEZI
MEAARGRSGEGAAPPPRLHQLPVYHPWESQSDYPPSRTTETKDAEQSSAATRLSWRPSYLRRYIIVGFITVFALIIAAIEVLLAISNKSDGIATSHPDQHYLWTYGPIAFLTLVAALWGARRPSADAKRTLLLDYVSGFPPFVVFTALRNRDWTVSVTIAVSLLMKVLIVISTGLITLSWTGVHLDNHPMVARDAFAAGGGGARLSKAGSLSYFVMKGLIGQNFTYPEGMSVDYAYQSVVTGLPDSAETRVTVDGFTNGLECVPADVVLTGAKPKDPRDPNSQMNLTVTSPGCDMRALQLSGPTCSGYAGNFSTCNFGRFVKTQCDGTTGEEGARVLLMFGNITYARDYSKKPTMDYTGRNPTYPLLAKLPQSAQMLCVPTYTISSVDVVRNGSQTQSVELSPGGKSRTLDSIRPWAIMDAHFSAYNNRLEGSSASTWGHTTNLSMVEVDVDEYFGVAIDSQFGPNTTAQVSDMFDRDFLGQFAGRYYRQFAAIIAKQSLTEPAAIDITGTAVFMANRLLVRDWSAQWMAGLTTACLVLSVVLLFTVPRQGVLPRNPSNIPDMASLILHSPDLQRRVRDLGAADEKSLVQNLERHSFQSGVIQNPATSRAEFAILDQQQFTNDASPRDPGTPLVRARRNLHPGILHPATRATLCLIVIGLIIALELLLQKSDREDGLGDVGNDTYIHYLWTTLPALTFGLVAMAFSSMDFQIRSLAPYMLLKKTVGTDAFMALDHLDMSIPRTIFKEARSGNLGALATTTMLLVASLFTIFSGSLFQALAIPSTGSITLRANQSFDLTPFGGAPYQGSARFGASIPSLILESNLSYPAFTHEDLAFPQLVSDLPIKSNATFNASTVSITAVVPAVRPRLDCRLYDMSKHRLNFTINSNATAMYVENPLGAWIEGEECKLKDDEEKGKYNILFTTYPNTTYVGIGDTTVCWPRSVPLSDFTGDILTPGLVQEMYQPVVGCSHLLYSWGQLDYSARPKPAVTHLSSLGCNLTFERVDVEATFSGPDLKLDTSTPGKAPRPREETARPSSMRIGAPEFGDGTSSLYGIYNNLAGTRTDPEALNHFFGLLVSSRYAIPVADLGRPEADERVAAAIRFQHGVIHAQNLAAQRVPAAWSDATLTASTSSSGSAPKNASDAQPRYAANATDPTGRHRVVQDAASTRALEALLGVALGLLLVGWGFVRETDVLPRAPTSIASVAALVAGGTCWRGCRGTRSGEPTERSPLRSTRRRLGTGAMKGRDFGSGGGWCRTWRGRALGGESENGFRRFGIFVVEGEGETKTMAGDDVEAGVVQLKVAVAGLNPHDQKTRDAGLFVADGSLPQVLANDVVGVVTQLGAGVTDYQVGDRVVSHARMGSWTEPRSSEPGLQEYALANVGAMAKIPPGVSDDEAATLPINAAAGFDYAGTTLLIIGGGSNNGRFGVQIAKLAGTGRIVVVGGDEAELASYGATHVLDRHGGSETMLARIRAVVGDDLVYAYDTVNDPAGQTLGLNALPSHKKGAITRLVPTGSVDEAQVVGKKAGFELRDAIGMSVYQQDEALTFWERLPGYLESGQIKPLKFAVKDFSAAAVNEVLDAYRDGKPVSKTHIHFEDTTGRTSETGFE